MHKPTFFLSSTIHDFKDLRSALKYFLEQQGCVVLGSEFNDFPKPLDSHTYDACLATLRKADYYVLLIGTRVGGWYDEAGRVSITQQEYREAYKLHEQGLLRIVSFVRSDVWRMREDRKELANHLSTLGVQSDLIKQIANFPSRSAEDADFITGFISEVTRDHETRTAVAVGGSKPTGNWVHTFDTFRDIADVINAQVFHGLPVEHAILRRLLLREIKGILRVSLAKMPDGKPFSPLPFLLRFREKHDLGMESRDRSAMTLDPKTWNQLAAIAIVVPTTTYPTLILERALESSAFLAFDSETASYREEPIFMALHMLRDEIRRFKQANTSDVTSIIYEASPRSRGSHSAPVVVGSMKLFMFLNLIDRWANIGELSKAICKALNGRQFCMPTLRPRSPVVGMDKELQRESVTDEELENLLNGDR